MRADFGGGPEHLYQLIKHLSPAIEAYIAAPEDFPYWDKYKEIAGRQKMFVLPHREFTFSRLMDLSQFCKNHKISLVHSHGKGAGIYSRLLRILTGAKVIHTYHGLHIGQYSPMKKLLYISLEKFLSALTTAAISVSPSEKHTLLFNGVVPGEKLHLIENGVEIPTEAEINSPSMEPFHILSITRFDYAKNSSLLVSIAKALATVSNASRQFVFDVVGDGEEKQHVQELVSANGLEEMFVFHGMQSLMNGYYRNAGCLLSTSRWEGLPLSVLEAMSYGVPIVASNVTGNRDLIKNDETGFLFELDKPGDAAQKILLLADDTSVWQAASQKARELVREYYSVTKMARRTEELYLKQF